ncbi:MAG: PHB depolymerase family esterase [Chloroflexales bacterium]|nr:PHB depolymerase family esterase [Chloroflexales bacterium]
MREATRLTRAGRLIEATALIQRTLQGAGAAAPSGTPDAPPAGDIIEGVFYVTEPAPAAAAPPALRDASTAEVPPLTAVTGAPPAAPPRHAKIPPRPRRAEPTPTPGSTGEGGKFLSGVYTAQAGTRPYKLYVPSAYRGQALPLVVMLHGCTQNPDDFATGTRMNELAEEHSCLVVYPAQVPGANASTCWNWFEPANQRRGQGEPALIAGITQQVGTGYAVDARRIFVAGLSAGGAMAVIMAMTYPDLYAAVGCHSGLAYGAAHDLPSALSAMGRAVKPRARRGAPSTAAAPSPRALPLIVFQGDQDTTVHPRNAEQLIAQWMALPPSDTPASTGPRKPKVLHKQVAASYAYTRASYADASGQVQIEHWLIHGAGHGWSGGSPEGSFTVPSGPDAAREMLRFFLAYSQPEG